MISISSPVVVRRGALRHYKTALKMQALGFIAATTGDVVVLPLTKPQRLRQERAQREDTGTVDHRGCRRWPRRSGCLSVVGKQQVGVRSPARREGMWDVAVSWAGDRYVALVGPTAVPLVRTRKRPVPDAPPQNPLRSGEVIDLT
eukprot:m51a1_g8041 hypothetical protein (145) ;mRNA; r:65578-66345